MTVITIGIEKGGTGKTTLVWGLGGALHDMGRSVLYVDMDGQCSLSHVLKYDSSRPTIYEVLTGQIRPTAAIQATYQGDLMAGDVDMPGLDSVLKSAGREGRLRKALENIAPKYDYVLIDTPPALRLPTINALTASDSLIIPVTADLLAVQGMDGIIAAAHDVREYTNPDLDVLGVSVGLWDARTAVSRAYLPAIVKRAEMIPCPVFNTKIRRGVAVLEAESGCMALTAWAPRSNQAKDYAALAREIEELRN